MWRWKTARPFAHGTASAIRLTFCNAMTPHLQAMRWPPHLQAMPWPSIIWRWSNLFVNTNTTSINVDQLISKKWLVSAESLWCHVLWPTDCSRSKWKNTISCLHNRHWNNNIQSCHCLIAPWRVQVVAFLGTHAFVMHGLAVQNVCNVWADARPVCIGCLLCWFLPWAIFVSSWIYGICNRWLADIIFVKLCWLWQITLAPCKSHSMS